MNETPRADESSGRGLGSLVFLVVAAIWLFLLHGFVSTPVAIMLALFGGVLARAGLYLTVMGVRYVFESVWYASAWLLGLALLAGAAATLAPAAPAELLTWTANGWKVLELRVERLEQAITDGDIDLVKKIASRGLGDPAGRTSSGIPLLQLVDDPEMIGVLLEAGLDPNAADVHAASESGRTGEETLRESGGVAPRGRDDWLEAGQVTTSDRASSGVSLQPDPLRPGEVGTLTIILGNSSQQDRVLEVQAILNNAVFFVGASHDGSVEDAVIPGLTSTVRWPPLALPGATRGKLEMTVLARPHDALPDLPTGDLSVDVRVIDLPQRSEEVLQLYQTRAGEAARTELDNPMALWPIVLPLVLVVALWLVWRRAGGSSSADKRFRRGRALAAGSALICFGIALAMAWSMLEPFVNFEEASCRILDRRVFAREVETTTQTRGTRRGNWQRTMQGHPLVAVEIDHGDEHRIAAGLATGMGTRSAHELRSLPIGSEKSCWLDPHNSRRFTLVREPSLGGVVGLGLVLALAVIFSAIAIRLRQGAVIRSE